MYGIPVDTKVCQLFDTTKIIPSNGINTFYNAFPFVFSKVVFPDLAFLRLAVYENKSANSNFIFCDRRFIGHRVIPVSAISPGYKHILLRNELGQPLGLPSIFVHIEVEESI
ncbi:hypothetical protein QYM36_010778 [Artemia franciscana]|uniref:Uncharacterized protein n=1 Tax=Artemia franciscana TaxID=6661 RepID=A0AA88I6V1_ARTSF|nr:hypothetical protein QYM36_010778 [Artemia franciscana]